MGKAFDILPPQKRLGIPPARVAAPVLDDGHVQPADLVVAPKPVAQVLATPRAPLWTPVFSATKSGITYLLVGLVSFAFFSALFWGFNKYQDRQRTALEEGSAAVSGEQTVTQPTIRILNGSGSGERLETLKDTLETKGYQIRSAGTSAQASDRTIIYFRSSAESAAIKLADELQIFAPSLERNDDIAGVDDIVILLGSLPPFGTP